MAEVRQLFEQKSFEEIKLLNHACEELNKFSALHPKQTCFKSACGYFDNVDI